MFFKGFLLGFSIAAPVGPIGLLCIQRTLARGRWHGFASGLGAATADALYGLVAALGLSAISQTLLHAQAWIQLGGALFLVGLGLRTISQKDSGAAREDRAEAGLGLAYVSVLVLTLANPATILSFLVLFAGLGVGATTAGTASAATFVAGVFFGSAAWWLLLSLLTGVLRHRLERSGRRWVNRLAGASLVGLGGFALVTLWLR
jgi:threonine/homoserine/homoserine lactone efflux protein